MLPDNCRQWFYFPIPMPTKNGQGPVSYEECDTLTYEVWDRLYNTHASFEHLSDAINKAIELSIEYIKENEDDTRI